MSTTGCLITITTTTSSVFFSLKSWRNLNVMTVLIIKLSLLLWLLAANSLAHAPNHLNDPNVLVGATIIFRHGDRNPVASYPGDPYSDEALYWPEGFGVLTTKGKIKIYNLGKYARKRYSTFQRRNVATFSSDQNRTIVSAMAFLAGFYGQNRSFLKHIDTFSPKGLGINVIPIKDDDFILTLSPCPNYDSLLDNYRQKKNPSEKYREAIDIINRHTRLNITTFNSQLLMLADTIILQKKKNLKLPDWAEELYADDVFFEIRDDSYINMVPTKELQRLRGGRMLTKFLEDSDKTLDELTGLSLGSNAQNSKNVQQRFPKITIVSGHDITIALWLINLQAFDWEMPIYGSTLFLELYQQHGKDVIIKVFYKNDPDKDAALLSIPGCPNPCNYKEFKKLLRPLLVENRAEACQNQLSPGMEITEVNKSFPVAIANDDDNENDDEEEEDSESSESENESYELDRNPTGHHQHHQGHKNTISNGTLLAPPFSSHNGTQGQPNKSNGLKDRPIAFIIVILIYATVILSWIWI